MKYDKHLREYAEEDGINVPKSTLIKARVKIPLAEKFKRVCKSNDWSESQGLRAGIMKLIDDCSEDQRKY